MSLLVSYTNKCVLITGSRRGLGRMISEYFLDRGAVVIGFSLGDSTFEHPNYHHIQVDISNPNQVNKAFYKLKKITDRIDILINNAGVIDSQYSMVMPPASAQAMLNTNVMGAFLITKEASKMMLRQKWGRIISIGSMASSLEPIGDSMYAASKAGLIAFSNVVAKELAPLNITCNTLAVTAIKTDMFESLSSEKISAVINQLPIPRLAELGDILNVLDFFCSERSSYVTAQTIYLGGLS